MNAVGMWLALGGAALFWPRRRDRGAHGRRPTAGDQRTRTVVTAVSVVALCVALAGGGRGLALALIAVPVATAVTGRSSGAVRRAALPATVPFALDLAAAVLRGGAPVSTALTHAAPAAGGELAERLTQLARLLRLGAGPGEAWHAIADDPHLAVVAAVSRRSATSGVRLAGAWEQLAAELRADRRAWALARAHRAGVLAMAPLGLCFLPAFVCLGVVPDVLGVARDVLRGGLGT